MEAKEYLNQYKAIRTRLDILTSEIERLRSEAESVSINLDGMPRGSGSGDKTARLAVMLAECETELMHEMSALWSVRMEIVNTLGQLTSKHQRLLYARYIEGKTWECIAYEMGITWRYCYMLHGSALAELDSVLNEKKI